MITSSEVAPSAASVLCSDAICVEVPTDNIRVGDPVLVLPGETIPIDVGLIANEILLELLKLYMCIKYLSQGIGIASFDKADAYITYVHYD